jgi:hypothetical protein
VELAGGWRRLRNEELRVLYRLPRNIRILTLMRIRCKRHVALRGENKNACRILMWKSKE